MPRVPDPHPPCPEHQGAVLPGLSRHGPTRRNDMVGVSAVLRPEDGAAAHQWPVPVSAEEEVNYSTFSVPRMPISDPTSVVAMHFTS